MRPIMIYMKAGGSYPSEVVWIVRRSLIRIGTNNWDFDGGVPAIDGFNFTEYRYPLTPDMQGSPFGPPVITYFKYRRGNCSKARTPDSVV